MSAAAGKRLRTQPSAIRRTSSAGTLEAESITRALHPDHSTSMGQALRFVQKYALVACSMDP